MASFEFPSVSLLIPRLKNGDEESWEYLVEMFKPGLLAKAKQLLRNSRVGRRADENDLVNFAFTKAWERREKLTAKTTAQIAGFLLTTIRNRFLDECRPSNPEQSSPSWFQPTSDEESPSQILICNEHEKNLHACIAELDPRQREVIVLRHLEGKKFREIADELNVTIGVVAGLARDGLAILTELLNART